MKRLAVASSPANVARRIFAAVEPWYDWGLFGIERYDTMERNGRCVEGEVRHFTIQWFGLHVGVQIGRLPRREGC